MKCYSNDNLKLNLKLNLLQVAAIGPAADSELETRVLLPDDCLCMQNDLCVAFDYE